MDRNDYKELGFMCGLEIHQRLATNLKLFCSCSAELAEDETVGSIIRYQKAVAGELGSIDPAAVFESMRRREFRYNIFKRHSCLVDIDEEPPHGVNKQALKTALALAHALKMHIINELEPMRKEVVDGSNPTAFQRSILIGINGSMKVGSHKINIPGLFVEEESSGIEGNAKSSIIYNTDRVGIPLIEIDTAPDISTPQEAKAVALQIGTLLRIAGGVQRGIGSIRQDVNVSIREGARVEIKGLQEVDILDKMIENEVIRQQKLIEIRRLLVRRYARVYEAKELTDVFDATNVSVIKNVLGKESKVMGFGLKGFKGALGMEINPGRRLGTEINEYAKMAGVGGIIHSDEDLGHYGFSSSEISGINKRLGLEDDDAFILIVGKDKVVDGAVHLAIERARYAIRGVPKETRGVASIDLYTTKFLRPLPGGSRMYPETDAKPVLISKAMLEDAVQNTPDIEKEVAWLKRELKRGELVNTLITSPRLQLYKLLSKSTGADKEFIANILVQKFRELKREGFDIDTIKEERLIELFNAYADGSITKQAVEELLKFIISDKRDLRRIIEDNKLGRVKGSVLKELIKREVGGQKEKLSKELLIKMIMSKHRLNIDGDELNSTIKKLYFS